MPVQTSPPSVPDSFPSFMSVFDGRLPNSHPQEDHNSTVQPLRVPTNVTSNTTRRTLPFKHRESISSMTSASTDSSPTTTISTFDSSASGPDTSPSSSPESPTSMPLSYPKFMPPARHHHLPGQTLSSAPADDLPPPSCGAPKHTRPDSPGRRARNLKNLSLRMPPPCPSGRPPIATASVVETSSQHHLSAPPSPAHAPAKSMRRKPANLTIRTPGFDRSFSCNLSEMVPPTPHALRHTESSPSLFSPSFGPKGGMQLPRPVTHHGSGRRSGALDDPHAPVPSRSDEGSRAVLHELAEEEDHLDSRESMRRNERGYPNGPVRIYDSGVYLYLEPTADEASHFDVVVNVAKEVANPFRNDRPGAGTVLSAWRHAPAGATRPSIAEPTTALSDASFQSAFEYPPSDESSPATPRTEPASPEYLHVGWDHNSEILDDLYTLCQLIDSRIDQGKKVLIHCQLGASRSASLVIAYGLYKNRHLDFNSMYELVKERSRWVGPNMSLIYQLTDFRARLARGGASPPAPEASFMPGGRRSSEPQPPRAGRMDPSGDAPPLPRYGSVALGSGQPAFPGLNAQAASSSLSVPATDPAGPTAGPRRGFAPSLSHKRSLSPRPLPLRQSSFHALHSAFRAGRAEFGPSLMAPEQGPYSLGKTDIFVRDAPEEPSALFSPRTTGFLAAPAMPSVSDALAAPGSLDPRFRSPMVDPRSPPPGNERIIMRNIDEFL
ncbi:putative protein-tyrosine phosphatase [Aspergillus candidus]|uniref:protein-tyrosine-phosphatase n=1 Tax=Aspergillus candidus TaxID=41067 RepID=A0A2I2EXX2_ASPCN|nr:hypothetical protein BDW47DRAFT_130551 [Aspergillus candidus]PLB33209.1 hypothetical protein BDW47DRAFT_130551 [Aspergillus candidus]